MSETNKHYNMEVKLIQPPRPEMLAFIANISRICSTRENDEFLKDVYNNKDLSKFSDLLMDRKSLLDKVVSLMKEEHHSVFEHIHITFLIKGMSRACSAQLNRHRLASPTQESQRYTKYKKDSPIFKTYVMPDSIMRNTEFFNRYVSLMTQIKDLYLDMINANIKAEDARYVLTNAHTTGEVFSCNLREFLFVLFPLRTSKFAQWEIKSIVQEMYDKLIEATCGNQIHEKQTNTEFFTQYTEWLSEQRQYRKSWRV